MYKYPVVLKYKHDPRVCLLMTSPREGIVVNITKDSEYPYSLYELITFKDSVESNIDFSKSNTEPEYYLKKLQKHINECLKFINKVTTLFLLIGNKYD